MRSASEHSGKRRGRKLPLSKAVAAKQILLLAAVPFSIFFALLFAAAFTLVARFLGGWSDDALRSLGLRKNRLRRNGGQRRVVIYRYGPSWGRLRHAYQPSAELLARLTPYRRSIVAPASDRRLAPDPQPAAQAQEVAR